MSELHYLQNGAIDKQKWDACVQRSDNGFIYATSVFLDHLAHHWDGIVIGDYQWVFPVPWKSKMGIRYVTPPVFTQQLGLIGPSNAEAGTVENILALIKKKIRYGEYLFNFRNNVAGFSKNNFILPLDKEYGSVFMNYEADLKYDLRKAEEAGLQIIYPHNHRLLTGLYRELYQTRFTKVSGTDFKNLDKLFGTLQANGQLIVRSCQDEKGELTGGIICAKDDKRIYLLLTASTQTGRKSRTIHLLVDSIIRENAQSGLIFDFEGSDIPGIAHFFRSFGSLNQPYTEHRWNDLPFPLNLVKKTKPPLTASP